MTDILGWDEPNTAELYSWLAENKLGKAEMSKAPWEILGPYAALDADATWQMFKYLSSVIQSLPIPIQEAMIDCQRGDIVNEINLVVEQQIIGMQVNLQKLAILRAKLEEQILGHRDNFLTQPRVVAVLTGLRDRAIATLEQAEPEKLTKTGSVAKRWESWSVKLAELKVQPAHELFNIDSPKQLAWLLYQELGYKVVTRTEKGDPSVDNKSLIIFGELGDILRKYRKLRDKLKFVSSLEEVQIRGVFHPTMRISGTITGRASGGNSG
jgi:hypothetical protein